MGWTDCVAWSDRGSGYSLRRPPPRAIGGNQRGRRPDGVTQQQNLKDRNQATVGAFTSRRAVCNIYARVALQHRLQ